MYMHYAGVVGRGGGGLMAVLHELGNSTAQVYNVQIILSSNFLIIRNCAIYIIQYV